MTVGRMTVACWITFAAMSVLFLPGFALATVVGEATTPVLGWLVAALVLVLWWGSFGYAMYLSQVVMRRGDPRLRKRGIRGKADVLSAEQTNTVIQEGEFEWQAPFVYKYRLRVELPDREPYETWCRICMSGIRKGQRVEVAVSPHNRHRVTIFPPAERRPETTRPGPSRVRSWQADLRRAASTDGDEDERLDQLAKLGDLRDRGVLTEEEFAAEKARLLGGP
jgi:hypothetical protein